MNEIYTDFKALFSTQRSTENKINYFFNFVPYENQYVGMFRQDIGSHIGGNGTFFCKMSQNIPEITYHNHMKCEDPRLFLYKNQPHAI